MSRIVVEKYPEELTLTLEQFLERFNLSLRLVEARSGGYYPYLVGAKVPECRSRRTGEVVAATNHVGGRNLYPAPTVDAATTNAAITLTALPTLVRDDGTEIDIRNIKVTAD